MHSPQPANKGYRQVNSQLSKNQGQVGLKTPLIGEKGSKKHQFAMTPEINTKTYAERSGLGGIASGMGSITGQ